MPPRSQSKIMYVCQQCGSESPKWQGRCPDCGEWNTYTEITVQGASATAVNRAAALLRTDGGKPVPLPEVSADAFPRLVVPGSEFNRVLGGGVVPGSLTLMSGDPGIGKCLTAESRVLDPTTGDFLPITAWHDQPRPVLAVNTDTLRLDTAQVSMFHDRGVHPIVELTTELGRKLRCTPSHPVLTPHGWHPVSALRAGDRVAAPRALPYFGNESLPEHVVKLIAYVLSDGSAQAQITVTAALPEVAEDLRGIATAFDMQLVIYPKAKTKAMQYRFANDGQQRRLHRQQVAEAIRSARSANNISWAEWARRAGVAHKNLWIWGRGQAVPSMENLQRLAGALDIPLSNLRPEARDKAAMVTPIARLLEDVGLRYKKAATKAVPTCIFRLPREEMVIFLKTLFTCDGSVYINKRGVVGISYSTISRRLAEDVQHLLLRFGLVATLRSKLGQVNGQPYTSYEIVLLGVNTVQQFLAEIGIMGRAAAQAQIAALSAVQAPSTQRDTIPTGPEFWSRLIAAKGSRTFRELSQQAGVRIANRRHEAPLCRSTVSQLAKVLPDPYFIALGDGDVYWDTITAIEPAGEAAVYDLTVPGPHNFVANDLIVHNSTMLLDVSAQLATGGRKVLYVSAEESIQQIKLRAERLGLHQPDLYLLGESDLDTVRNHISQMKPGLVVIDSIQTVFLPELPSTAGSVTQVRESTAALMKQAKTSHIPMFLVGHVTKEGNIAGPRVLEHMVDAVLYLEGDRFHQYRLLRSVKNRFGSTNEVGVFEMAAEGLIEVPNPSAAFLAERSSGVSGSTVAVTMEGTRPLLVEVQALTTPSATGMPRRTANGIDINRLHLLLAVLTKRMGVPLYNQDVYVNVVGGLKIDEPAVDLAVAVAIASSFKNVQVDPELAVIGEVGLSGELRSVGQLDRRLNEAAKLGFRRAVYPKTGRAPRVDGDIQARAVTDLPDAIEAALTA